MKTQPRVFLSYAREDRAKVAQIYDSLRAEGFGAWMDTRDILPGQDWALVIREAIRQADMVLVFLSHNSVSKRGYVQREIRAALAVLSELPEGTLFIIPVRLDDCQVPELLRQIQWVDLFEENGWSKMLLALRHRLQHGEAAANEYQALREWMRTDTRMAGTAKRPHVFVAMPFSVDMEDLYYYGIRQAIHANDLDCERIDEAAFTGDILQQIKTRICTAVAAVAEVSRPNPNVHLELGYAWGKEIPTVLLLRDGEQPCFDVRGQRCLKYRTIKNLEDVLTGELTRLRAEEAIKRA